MVKKNEQIEDVILDPNAVIAPEDVMKREMAKQNTSDQLKAQAAVKDTQAARDFADAQARTAQENADAIKEDTPSQAEYRKMFEAYKKQNPVKAKMKEESGEFARKLAALKK